MKIIHDNICEIIFCNNFFPFILHSEKRWRRKQHYQINHIKNISSSNYISFRIIHNITHKVDINEMKKWKKEEILSFSFYLFMLTLYKTRFVQLSVYKLRLQRRERKWIDRFMIACTLRKTRLWYCDDSSSFR